MKIKNKKASIFVYVLILINVSLIIWYVVYNNTYILNNNIDIWRNSEEVFSVLSDKWNIAIESVRQYNSNGWWFSDLISCPQNITMSWSTNRTEWISSEMRYDFWTIYCSFTYNWEEVRLFFNPDTTDFTRVYYNWELRDIVNDFFYNEWVVSWLWPTNIDSTNTTEWNSWAQNPDRIFDWNENTQYLSRRVNRPKLTLGLWSPKTISKVIINKKANNWANFWNNWNLIFTDDTWSTTTVWVTWVRNREVVEVNFSYGNLNLAPWATWITSLTVEAIWNNMFLDIVSIQIFEWGGTGEEYWFTESEFTDSDNTYMSFDSSWIWWNDNIDDNMNSDNYRSTSTQSISYPWDHLDDDVYPRLTFFWSVPPNSTEFYNIFWNNHITNDMIAWNFHNDDDPLIAAKIWDVTRWFLFLDVFTFWWDLDYDIKIIQFDRDAYKDRFTLLPTAVYETSWVNQNYWYIQLNWNTMSLSPYKTWNEFEFNFEDNDYSLYLTNRIWENLAYKLTWEERPNVWTWPSSSWNLNEKWRAIYINPIDDSKPWLIEVIANHIIAWWDKNYIWENFLMVWSK